jgi:hypothetical protein
MEEFARLAAKSDHSQGNVLNAEPLNAICNEMGIKLTEFYDRYASYIAVEFLAGRLTFEQADSVANDIFGHSEHSLEGLAWDVFQAFDEGEYYHSEDSRDMDPVQTYTVPMLLELFPNGS